MYEKYMEALDKNQAPFIHEIFDSIQTELQKAGKQMPECVWNDDTRYLVFKKNKGGNEQDGDDEMEPKMDFVELASTSPASPNDEKIVSDLVEGNKGVTLNDDAAEPDIIFDEAGDSPYDIEMQTLGHERNTSTFL